MYHSHVRRGAMTSLTIQDYGVYIIPVGTEGSDIYTIDVDWQDGLEIVSNFYLLKNQLIN